MPKEMSHWFLADLIRGDISGNTLFAGPVRAYPNLFFLGAVSPDIPFYYVAGPGSTELQALALPFHRQDSRALTPVLDFLDRFRDGDALALAAGAICHILSDTAFHPLVCYLAGMEGVHAGATARHRYVETALDVHFRSLAGPGARTSLWRILTGIEVSNRRLTALLAGLFGAENRWLGMAVRSHAAFQAAFRSRVIRAGLFWMSRGRRRIPESVTSLVYPVDRPVFLPYFSGEFRYRDPADGRYCRASTRDLIRQARSGAVNVMALIARRMGRGDALGDLPSHPDLPRIRPGFRTCRYWRKESAIRHQLYSGAKAPGAIVPGAKTPGVRLPGTESPGVTPGEKSL